MLILVCVPVLLSAWCFGPVGGLTAGLVGFLINALSVYAIRGNVIWTPLWVGGSAVAFLGIAAGYTLALNDRLLCEVAERKRAEESIKGMALEWELTFNSIGSGVAIHDTSYIIRNVNAAFAEMVGKQPEQILGKACYQVVHHADSPCPRCPHRRMLETKLPAKEAFFEPVLATHVEISASPIFDVNGDISGSVHIMENISARVQAEENLRKIEEQLAQVQKLEAVGRLAGGVAHDFNNLMTTIYGYSDLVLVEKGIDETIIENVQGIKKAAGRAAELTQQLLAFSRKQVRHPTVININEILRNLEKMLIRLIGEDIAISLRLDPELGNIKADPGQIEQIIMNLAVNARDAMPNGGLLALTTQNVWLDDTYCLQHPEAAMRDGPYIQFAMCDTGQGIDSQTTSHIFEPFFTTKAVGEGTGLGLSIVYGIVKQNDGYVWVYSEVGKGSTFKIYLPRCDAIRDEQAHAQKKPAIQGGIETLLFVEDEKELRTLMARILREYGYTVIEGENGVEALTTVKNHPHIDLLVTDVVMPEMNGKTLSKLLLDAYPKLRVLFLSGYPTKAISHHGIIDEGVEYLQKPFSARTLAHKIRSILDSER